MPGLHDKEAFVEDGSKCVIETMREYGSDLSVYDASFLEMTLKKRREKAGVRDLEEYCNLLRENSGEAGALKESMGITYSSFFREPFSFALVEKMLPALAKCKAESGEIRVWSAGCADGQEAYSLAMLLEECAARENARYRIFATDISKSALRTAEAGAYRSDAFHDVRCGLVKKYFLLQGDFYRASPALKKNITFFEYDLLDKQSAYPTESIFGGFDIVFCRNVMLYYRPGLRRFMLDKLVRSVRPGGMLVVGEAERAFAARYAGLAAACESATVFIKPKPKKTGKDS